MYRWSIASALVLLTSTPLAAEAQALDRADEALLLRCMGEVGPHPADRLRCLDTVALDCNATAAGDSATPPSYEACILREISAWSAIADAAVDELDAAFDALRRSALSTAQEAWRDHVAADCMALPIVSETGDTEALDCLHAATGARAITLRMRADELAEGAR